MRSLGRPGKVWLQHKQVELLTLVAAVAASTVAAPLQLISTLDPPQAPPAGGGCDSVAPIIGPDGRYVLFASLANNLVLAGNGLPLPAGFPLKLNVFLRDRTNLTTTLVSANLAGTGEATIIPCQRASRPMGGMRSLRAVPATWLPGIPTTRRTSSSETSLPGRRSWSA